MKISKADAIKLVNQHSSFEAVSFNALTDKKKMMKEIEALLKTSATVLVMK